MSTSHSTKGGKPSSLTIVIPAFNESGRILKYLRDIDEYITRQPTKSLFSVIVINDGSLDDTKGIVSSWIRDESNNKSCFELVSYIPNRGKGYAVKEGFLRASSDLVMYTDADGASPIKEVGKLLSCINDGYDVACGSRILKSEETKVKMGLKRRAVGFVFHLILKFLGLADLRDTQCGFKLFKTSAAKKIIEKQKCFNYSFDVEYLFLANYLGYKIKEVAINWYHIEGSQINLLKDSIKMLLEVLKIRFVYKYNVN